MPAFRSLQGRLLVATPSLVDPNFLRTVVLVTEHTPQGAMGVVLNRATELRVADAVPVLVDLVEEDEPVYTGGPVRPEAVLALAEFADPGAAAALVLGSVGFLPADPDPQVLTEAATRARVFAGYAGWDGGQLEAEVEQEAWIEEAARIEDVFADPETLWSDVLRRKGGPYRLLALMPPDPKLN